VREGQKNHKTPTVGKNPLRGGGDKIMVGRTRLKKTEGGIGGIRLLRIPRKEKMAAPA